MQNIQFVWKCHVLFKIPQLLKFFDLRVFFLNKRQSHNLENAWNILFVPMFRIVRIKSLRPSDAYMRQ